MLRYYRRDNQFYNNKCKIYQQITFLLIIFIVHIMNNNKAQQGSLLNWLPQTILDQFKNPSQQVQLNLPKSLHYLRMYRRRESHNEEPNKTDRDSKLVAAKQILNEMEQKSKGFSMQSPILKKNSMFNKVNRKISSNHVSQFKNTHMQNERIRLLSNIYIDPIKQQQRSKTQYREKRKNINSRKLSAGKRILVKQPFEPSINEQKQIFGLQIKKYDLLQKQESVSGIKQNKQAIAIPIKQIKIDLDFLKYYTKVLQKKPSKQRAKKKREFKSVTIHKKLLHNFNHSTYEDNSQQFKEFIFKLYFTNAVLNSKIDISQKKYQPKYQIYIGPGNNKTLIKNIILKRSWWKISTELTINTQFLWTQTKSIQFINQQAKSTFYQTNTPLKQKAISSNKKNQYANQQDLKIMHQKDYKIYKDYKKNSKAYQKNFKKRFQVIAKGPIRELNPYQRIHNHFEFNHLLGNKKALLNNMNLYYKFKGISLDQYDIPRTFHINVYKDKQTQKFISLFKQKEKRKQNNIWIIKPGENSNRGQGIQVSKNLLQIIKIIKNKKRTHIVQQYLSDLLLYNKRKFDIRTYLLITQVNGVMKAYWYEEGYIRTSSEFYRLDDLNDPMIHLTNDAIQKHGRNYGKYQPGNKISYKQLQKYLEKESSQKFSVNKLVSRMKKIATDAILSCYFKIDPNCRENNFQIFGLDFIIDNHFKPWLLQVNTNPCLQISAPLLRRLIPSMLQNAFQICLDPFFPPPEFIAISTKKNRFQLIFDSQYDRINTFQQSSGEDNQNYEDDTQIFENEPKEGQSLEKNQIG